MPDHVHDPVVKDHKKDPPGEGVGKGRFDVVFSPADQVEEHEQRDGQLLADDQHDQQHSDQIGEIDCRSFKEGAFRRVGPCRGDTAVRPQRGPECKAVADQNKEPQGSSRYRRDNGKLTYDGRPLEGEEPGPHE